MVVVAHRLGDSVLRTQLLAARTARSPRLSFCSTTVAQSLPPHRNVGLSLHGNAAAAANEAVWMHRHPQYRNATTLDRLRTNAARCTPCGGWGFTTTETSIAHRLAVLHHEFASQALAARAASRLTLEQSSGRGALGMALLNAVSYSFSMP